MKTARPINKDDFEQCCRCGFSIIKVKAFLRVGEDSIMKFCQKNYGKKFVEVRNDLLAITQRALISRAINLSLDKEKPNTAMLAMSLKNLCGWSDNPVEDTKEENSEILLAIKTSLENIAKK